MNRQGEFVCQQRQFGRRVRRFVLGVKWLEFLLSACKVEIVLKQRREAFAVSYFPFLCILFNIPIGGEVTQYARVLKNYDWNAKEMCSSCMTSFLPLGHPFLTSNSFTPAREGTIDTSRRDWIDTEQLSAERIISGCGRILPSTKSTCCELFGSSLQRSLMVDNTNRVDSYVAPIFQIVPTW
jgi:hypothetical protein